MAYKTVSIFSITGKNLLKNYVKNYQNQSGGAINNNLINKILINTINDDAKTWFTYTRPLLIQNHIPIQNLQDRLYALARENGLDARHAQKKVMT